MDPKLIDYYMMDCAIISEIAIESRSQIDFGNPGADQNGTALFLFFFHYIGLTKTALNLFL